MIKEGDRVKLKNKWPTGCITAFYAYNNEPDKVYEVEKIQGSDVYVKDRVNYFRMSSLEVVE